MHVPCPTAVVTRRHVVEWVQEMKQLKPGERVLVIGAASEPQLCVKKDEKALLGFFQKHIYLPAPDYASRKLLLPGLVARHGAAVDPDFDWPTLAQITDRYTSGQLDLVWLLQRHAL